MVCAIVLSTGYSDVIYNQGYLYLNVYENSKLFIPLFLLA